MSRTDYPYRLTVIDGRHHQPLAILFSALGPLQDAVGRLCVSADQELYAAGGTGRIVVDELTARTALPKVELLELLCAVRLVDGLPKPAQLSMSASTRTVWMGFGSEFQASAWAHQLGVPLRTTQWWAPARQVHTAVVADWHGWLLTITAQVASCTACGRYPDEHLPSCTLTGGSRWAELAAVAS